MGFYKVIQLSQKNVGHQSISIFFKKTFTVGSLYCTATTSMSLYSSNINWKYRKFGLATNTCKILAMFGTQIYQW